jgi:para-nitrobenzyl esterase
VREATSTLVQTAEGLLRGSLTPRLRVYKGIRYGEDTSSYRFSPPVAVRPWEGVRDASEFGPPCIQTNPDTPPWLDGRTDASEDCLFLNIWAPLRAEKLPVMVWIHGGAYEWGSGGAPMYDGAALAERGDVITVTINHRLNIFGYLYFGGIAPQFADSANLGQLDLVAALRWIRRNIAAFGGDPDNVTIFGESGGGGKISALLGMPSARGLFAKAIMQSGTQLKVRIPQQDDELARAVIAELGIAADAVDELRTIDAHRLYDACRTVLADTTLLAADFQLPLAPILDPATIPYQLDTAESHALWADVPVMIGITEEEATYFALQDGRVPDPADDNDLINQAMALFPDLRLDDARRLLTAYRDVMPAADRSRLLIAIATGHWLWGAVETQAALKAANAAAAPAFVFIFGWQDPFAGGNWAVHGEDVGFVFDNFDIDEYLEFGVNSGALRAEADPLGERFRLRDAVMDAWLSFARDGVPASPLLPQWPAYSTRQRAVMRLDATSSVRNDPWGPAVRTALAQRRLDE